MKPKFNTIFFDLDGTLSDSFLGIENGIHFALKKCGITNINRKTIKKMIGIPLKKSLKQYFIKDDEEMLNQAITYFREYYSSTGVFESVLYPGVFDLIKELSLVSKLYIITAKPTDVSLTLLKHHKIFTFFTDVFGFERSYKNFEKSILINNISPRPNAIMVGDKKQDIEAGKKVNIFTVGVLYGYDVDNEIANAKPDFIVESVSDLKKLLL